MTKHALASAGTAPIDSLTSEPIERVRVWDPLVRYFHWALVAGFATAYIVGDEFLGLHVWAGYLVLALIAVRLVWGIIGTRHARFTDFVCGPRQVLAYMKDILHFRAKRYLGHNPAGGGMVILLLLAVTATGVSGVALYGAQDSAGPWASTMSGLPAFWGGVLKEGHEFFANLTLVLIVVHVAGVLLSSLAHRENLIGSMISGYKRKAD